MLMAKLVQQQCSYSSVRIYPLVIYVYSNSPSKVAILDAGRNALSLFLLLIVALGLSVVRESLGRAMFRCRLLTGAHFIFGGAHLPLFIYL